MTISPVESLRFFRGNDELILAVNDEVSILKATRLQRKDFGYRGLTAQDGIVAITLYQAHQSEISAVLMDMIMPSMDGETAIMALKAKDAQFNNYCEQRSHPQSPVYGRGNS